MRDLLMAIADRFTQAVELTDSALDVLYFERVAAHANVQGAVATCTKDLRAVIKLLPSLLPQHERKRAGEALVNDAIRNGRHREELQVCALFPDQVVDVSLKFAAPAFALFRVGQLLG